MKWYLDPSFPGNVKAQYLLGVMSEQGKGMSGRDYDTALQWYRLAADQNYAAAQNKLGFMYTFGKGVDLDYDEAFRWYGLAAAQGDSSAQENIGYMYKNGLGVKRNNEEALRWYKRAIKNGNEFAAESVDELDRIKAREFLYGYDLKEAYIWAENNRIRQNVPAEKVRFTFDGEPNGNVVPSLFYDGENDRTLMMVSNYDLRLIYYYEIINLDELERKHPDEVRKLFENGMDLFNEEMRKQPLPEMRRTFVRTDKKLWN